jgi:hypothetical protein
MIRQRRTEEILRRWAGTGWSGTRTGVSRAQMKLVERITPSGVKPALLLPTEGVGRSTGAPKYPSNVCWDTRPIAANSGKPARKYAEGSPTLAHVAA